MKKSIVAQINLGFAAVEGLMLPDGTYAVSVPQIAKLFSLDSVHAARDVKTLVKKNDSFSLSNEEEQKHGKRSQGKSFSLSNQEKQKHGKRSQRKDSSLFNQQELLALNTDSDVSYDVITQTQIEGQKHKVNVITLENFCKVIYELQKKVTL